MSEDHNIERVPEGVGALTKDAAYVCKGCWEAIIHLSDDFEEITQQLEERVHQEELVSVSQWRGFTRVTGPWWLFSGAWSPGSKPQFSFEACAKCGSKQGGYRFPVLEWRKVSPLEQLANTKGDS